MEMEFDLIQTIGDYGLMAGLFVWMLWQTMKKNDEREQRMIEESTKREEKLHSLLEVFGEKYDGLANEIRSLKDSIDRKKGDE